MAHKFNDRIDAPDVSKIVPQIQNDKENGYESSKNLEKGDEYLKTVFFMSDLALRSSNAFSLHLAKMTLSASCNSFR